ncbi:Uncharacterized membrane protein [Propionibacterium cyclohexanicum]|uniref:Uncharacterized membrane protein n=1 Tax=Propionibacterium cyclohexanicum TaxID=64702 RepID=A0A1H9TUG2_9ACTN|nr:DUF1345 domain-containing protein [Propionibacterium cyclohexanicum]SES00628.1 Uncharacterized membrane protein [Propionibacterium cyclohexanicum]
MKRLADSMPLRLALSAVLGLAAGLAFSAVRHGAAAAMFGWAVTAGLFVASTWLLVLRMDAAETRRHASHNDPSRGLTDTVLLAACLGSIVGLGLLLFGAKEKDLVIDGLIGTFGIIASWAAVHTLYCLRYAHLYYAHGGGVDFNGDTHPDYRDFAYLAFTLGMTYQVSDTDLKTKAMRRTALEQGLISYLLGAVVLASMINMLVQLASNAG